MDRRSWLWRRKSSERSPGKAQSSRSVSSERHSGEQEVLRTFSITSSPNHSQSPEVSSKDVSSEANEITTTLNDKLSAALFNISAKEDLVKQHARVAEEAVLGWENAEKEVLSLKQLLEAALKKNASLEDKSIHLDAALKECVRQLRLSREEQEQKIHDAIVKKTLEWESHKSELEIRLVELEAQLQAKTEITTSFDHDFISKVEALKEENSALKFELVTLSDDFQLRTQELELCTRTAETASKQHLDSIKKVARLEAECRKLRAAVRKSSSNNEHKFMSNSHYAESVTDSHSDAGERFLNLENEQSCSDSCGSAPIADLDQIKKENDCTRARATLVEIGLMDDFLEMEKLVALPEGDHGSSSIENDADSDPTFSRDSSSTKELGIVRGRMAELEEMVEKMNSEKVEIDRSLAKTNVQLESTYDQLVAAECKLVELQRQLNLFNEEKQALEIDLESTNVKKNELEFQLDSALTENVKLHERVTLLDRKFEEEKKLSSKLEVRCQHMEAAEATGKEIKCQLELANGEISELKSKVSLLQGKVEEEKKLSVELASRCWKMDTLKIKKEELESQLESANLELNSLREKSNSFERKLEDEKAFSAKLLAKCQTIEIINANKVELEHQLITKHLEIGKLQEKVDMLEGNVEEERTLSLVLAANIKAIEANRDELTLQFESDKLEIRNLQEKVGTLEKQVEEEKTLSAEFSEKYHKLEDELSSKQQAPEFHLSSCSNKNLMIRQDKEIALAADKFAECQKTIASLNQQLKSLMNFDDFMVLAHNLGSNGEPLDPSISPESSEVSSALPNVEWSDSRKLSPFSAGHLEFSFPSRTNSVIETK